MGPIDQPVRSLCDKFDRRQCMAGRSEALRGAPGGKECGVTQRVDSREFFQSDVPPARSEWLIWVMTTVGPICTACAVLVPSTAFMKEDTQ